MVANVEARVVVNGRRAPRSSPRAGPQARYSRGIYPLESSVDLLKLFVSRSLSRDSQESARCMVARLTALVSVRRKALFGGALVALSVTFSVWFFLLR